VNRCTEGRLLPPRRGGECGEEKEGLVLRERKGKERKLPESMGEGVWVGKTRKRYFIPKGAWGKREGGGGSVSYTRGGEIRSFKGDGQKVGKGTVLETFKGGKSLTRKKLRSLDQKQDSVPLP